MINNNIAKVIDLHKIDKRLSDINSERGDLPSRINDINQKIDSFSNQNKDHQTRLEDIEKRKVLLNADLSDKEKKINDLNDQMYKGQSNKEYEALLLEIDHLNKENDQNLLDLENFEEEVANINTLLNGNKEELESLNEKLLKNENRLKDANSLIEKEEKDLEKDRKNIESELLHEENLLEIYNDKKVENNGLAFAQINRGCCENCYSSLPPQLVIDANNCNQLVTCPTCNVLLYSEETNKED